jgi:hypothetical protein
MSGKQAGNFPGLSPVKGQEFNFGSPAGFQDQFPSLSLGIAKIPPARVVLVVKPTVERKLYAPSGNPQGRLRSEIFQGRAPPGELISNLISSHLGFT